MGCDEESVKTRQDSIWMGAVREEARRDGRAKAGGNLLAHLTATGFGDWAPTIAATVLVRALRNALQSTLLPIVDAGD